MIDILWDMLPIFVIIWVVTWLAVRRMRQSPLAAAAAFNRDVAARGLGHEEASRELLLRMAMARVQRRASDRVVHQPFRAYEIIAEEIQREVQTMKKRDRQAAYAFNKAAKTLYLNDFLTKNAYKRARGALERHRPVTISRQDAEDFYSATTRR